MGILESIELLKSKFGGEFDKGKISVVLRPLEEKPSEVGGAEITREISAGEAKPTGDLSQVGGKTRHMFPKWDNLVEKWNSVALAIGLGFLNLWNKKHWVFPILLFGCGIALWYQSVSSSLLSFTLCITVLLTTLVLAFVGLVVMDQIQRDIASTGRIVTQTLVGIVMIVGFLLYLDLSIGGFLPAPPLVLLIGVMWAIPLVPYVTLAILLPPLLGSIPRFKPKWNALRGKYPFWGIYCAVLGGLLILYVPLKFFPLYMYSSLVFWGMFLGSSTLALAAILAMFPRKDSTKVTGLFLVILAALSWVGTLGGVILGSILCVVGGAHAYAWTPTSRS